MNEVPIVTVEESKYGIQKSSQLSINSSGKNCCHINVISQLLTARSITGKLSHRVNCLENILNTKQQLQVKCSYKFTIYTPIHMLVILLTFIVLIERKSWGK